METNRHGRTLWDLVYEYPGKSLVIFLFLTGGIGYGIYFLVNAKYSIKAAGVEFTAPPPVIIQDTSHKSKLDTTTQIKLGGKKNQSRQMTLTSPNKDTVKSEVVNVTSNNQQGGITANNVNIGPAPRKLDLTLTAQLLNSIPDKEEHIDITSVLGDPEAFQFATDIKSFLLSQGYIKVNGVNQALFTQPVKGQFLNKDSSGVKILIGSK